ncbi:MAG: hypothetical protein CL409_00025 [Acidimicrobiaceae bacterium]|nr:hypothetical protein [Acidimicrobiaceae bacterium]
MNLEYTSQWFILELRLTHNDIEGVRYSLRVYYIPSSENILQRTKEVNYAIDAIKSCDPFAVGSRYRNEVKHALEDVGWSGKVNLEHDSKRYIDGIFNDVGLVVQLGHKGAATSYFLNLEYMYVTGKINSAIFVTQTKDHAVKRYQRSNPESNSDGNYCTMDRIISDFELFSNFLTCPICIIAIE